MSGPYHYSIGPLTAFVTDDGLPGLRAPDGISGWIRLSHGGNELGFFASANDLGAGFTTLNPGAPGDLREIAADALMRAAWESATRVAVTGDTLLALLVDHLTTGADPAGDAACKPLVPTVSGELEIHLGGHSKVWSRRMTGPTDPHWNRYADLLKRDLAEVRVLSLSGKMIDPTTRGVNVEYHRKVLDATREKLLRCGVTDWKLVLPKGWDAREGPQKHATTIVDDFNRTDASPISAAAAGYSWTVTFSVNDTLAIVSNQVNTGGSASMRRARAESDLSSADHYGQIVATALGTNTGRHVGPCARYQSAADTCYQARFAGSTGTSVLQMQSISEGTATPLGTGTNQSKTPPDTIQQRCNGSTISVLFNGASVESLTDTSIPGGTRCGLGHLTNSGGADLMDDFEAADLSVQSNAPRAMHHYRMRRA